MNSLMPRIDMHAHYIPNALQKLFDRRGINKPDGYPLPKWDLPIQFEYMDKLNIVFAALTISSPHPHFGDAQESIDAIHASNEEGLKMAREYPDKLGIIATLPLPEIEASIDEIEFALKEGALGFVMPSNAQGVYLGDERLDPVFERLNKHKALLTFHPTTPSAVPQNVLTDFPRPIFEFLFDTTRAVMNMIVNGVPDRYPDIKYVLPHGGAVLPMTPNRIKTNTDRFYPDKKMDIFASLRFFNYDLAGYVVPNQLGTLLRTTELSHLVYGADGPHTMINNALFCAKELDETDILTDEQRNIIYIENAKRLLGI